jgi:hypothetical protein
MLAELNIINDSWFTQKGDVKLRAAYPLNKFAGDHNILEVFFQVMTKSQ